MGPRHVVYAGVWSSIFFLILLSNFTHYFCSTEICNEALTGASNTATVGFMFYVRWGEAVPMVFLDFMSVLLFSIFYILEKAMFLYCLLQLFGKYL